jgi:hypothetical protein
MSNKVPIIPEPSLDTVRPGDLYLPMGSRTMYEVLDLNEKQFRYAAVRTESAEFNTTIVAKSLFFRRLPTGTLELTASGYKIDISSQQKEPIISGTSRVNSERASTQAIKLAARKRNLAYHSPLKK